jgi:hypothetical protein
MKLRRCLLAQILAASTVFIGTPLAHAAADGTEIKVVVKNEFQKPVPNAVIILDFLGARSAAKLGMKKKVHWEIHTNQEGLGHFPPVPEGSVQLQVITTKYQTFGQKMDVEGPERLVEVTLHPPQSQYSAHPPLKPADPPKQ